MKKMTNIRYEWDLEESKPYLVTEIEKGSCQLYGETFILTLDGFGKIYAPEGTIDDIKKHNLPAYIVPITFTFPGGGKFTQYRFGKKQQPKSTCMPQKL